MKRNRHKRKTRHFLLVTSDSAKSGVKQYLYRPGFLWILIAVLGLLLSILAAYLFAENHIWSAIRTRNDAQIETIGRLETEKLALQETIREKNEEKNSLNSEIDQLNQQIKLLSETVNEKVQSEAELTAKIESLSIPSLFPLTGSASMAEESDNGNPAVLLQASVGSTVVATASGKVSAVSDDLTYGHCVIVDHENGYLTIYRNKGNTNLKIGDSVVQGTTIFLITKDNTKVCYQIKKDEIYINPVTMIDIDG